MRKAILILYVCSSFLLHAQEFGFAHGANYWGLTFEAHGLSPAERSAIAMDFQITFSRFSESSLVRDPPSVSNGVEIIGHIGITGSHSAKPWKTGGFNYTLTNGTNCLIVFDELCVR